MPLMLGLALLLAVPADPSAAGAVGYYRFPAIHGDAIVFGASLSGITGGSTVTVATASYSAGSVSARTSEATIPTVIGTMNHQRRRLTTP